MKKYYLVEVWKKIYSDGGKSRKVVLVAVRPSKLIKLINHYPVGTFEFHIVGSEYYKFDFDNEE